MVIQVKVKAGKKNHQITEIGKDRYEINLTSIPEHGKANKELIDRLSDYFEVSKSQVLIINGEKSKLKTVEIR